MADDTKPVDPADERRLAELAGALADAVDRTLPGWVERVVGERIAQYRGGVTDEERAAAAAAGAAARDDVGVVVRALLDTDVDEQRANPLALLRDAVSYPTQVLAAAGIPEVERSAFDERAFPDDVYALAPATWADVDESLHEPGLRWSAAKAFVFKARRRAEGRT